MECIFQFELSHLKIIHDLVDILLQTGALNIVSFLLKLKLTFDQINGSPLVLNLNRDGYTINERNYDSMVNFECLHWSYTRN